MSNDDLVECISVKGIIIDLRDVSADLRRQYYAVTRAVGRLDKARSDLKRVGELILQEQLPRLALKHAPAVRGSRAVAARLMDLPQ